MNKKKRFISFMIALVMVISLYPNTDVVNAASKKKTALSSKTATLKVGQKKTVKLKNYKKLSKSKIKKVKWSTTNKKVVTVKYSGKYRQNGKITAKKKGTAYVKVKYNGKTYKCKVVVKAKEEPTTKAKTTEKVTTEAKTTEKTTEKVTTEENTEKPTHVHEWGDWKVSEEVTCVKDGTEERKCSSCSKVEQRTIKAPGHEYKESTQNATCEEDGSITKTCSKCGNVETKVIKATGHKWNDGIVKQEATYTAPGVKEYTCTVCSKTKEESIPMLNETEHSWNEGIITTQPTCTSAGEKTYTCKNCGGTRTESVQATGHSYNDGIITTQATCTVKGVRTFTCSECNDSYTEDIPATGHTVVNGGSKEAHKICSTCKEVIESEHTFTEEVTRKQSCTNGEVTKYSCDCGYSYTSTTKPALGHNWEFTHVEKQATCTEQGQWLYTCSNCGDTKYEAKEALGHDWDEHNVCIRCAIGNPNVYISRVNVGVSDSKPVYAYFKDTDKNGLYEVIVRPVSHANAIRSGAFRNNKDVESVKFTETSNGYASATYADSSADYMFEGCINLASLDLTGFYTFKLKTAKGFCKNCSKLSNITFKSTTNNSFNCTDLSEAFWGCNSLVSIPSGYLNSKGSCFGIFYECTKLESAEIRYSPTDLQSAFYNCSSLKELTISSFEDVVCAQAMCKGCSNLSSFNIKYDDSALSLNNTMGMFEGCSSLETLDLSKINETSIIAFPGNMFKDCSKLKVVYKSRSAFKVLKDDSTMWSNCGVSSFTDVD